jgi:hypothetical protein
MPKARSRLDLSRIETAAEEQSATNPRSRPPRRGGLGLLQRYLKHSPTLLLSLPFVVMLWWIITSVRPGTIKNIGLTNSYLVFVLPFFLANLFAFSFLLLKTRRGLAISLLLTLWLFLKLQQVVITPVIFGGLVVATLGPLLVIEVFARFMVKN